MRPIEMIVAFTKNILDDTYNAEEKQDAAREILVQAQEIYDVGSEPIEEEVK